MELKRDIWRPACKPCKHFSIASKLMLINFLKLLFPSLSFDSRVISQESKVVLKNSIAAPCKGQGASSPALLPLIMFSFWIPWTQGYPQHPHKCLWKLRATHLGKHWPTTIQHQLHLTSIPLFFPKEKKNHNTVYQKSPSAWMCWALPENKEGTRWTDLYNRMCICQDKNTQRASGAGTVTI